MRTPSQPVFLPQFGFKRNKLRSGVEDVLAYLERCRISEDAGATQPLALEVHASQSHDWDMCIITHASHASSHFPSCNSNALQPRQVSIIAASPTPRVLSQVYLDLLETVGGVLGLALAPHCTFLPRPYVQALLHSPLIGQDSYKAQMQLAAVSDLWSGEGHRVSCAALMQQLSDRSRTGGIASIAYASDSSCHVTPQTCARHVAVTPPDAVSPGSFGCTATNLISTVGCIEIHHAPHAAVLCVSQPLLAMVRRAAALLRSLLPELAPNAEPRPGLAVALQRQLRGDEAAGEAI